MKKLILISLLLVLSNLTAFSQESTMPWDSAFASIMSLLMIEGVSFDGDETLEFYWTAPTDILAAGYFVKLFINGAEHPEEWTTDITPTSTAPYQVPIVTEIGSLYRLQVVAFDSDGVRYKPSELSKPVLRIGNVAEEEETKPRAIN